MPESRNAAWQCAHTQLLFNHQDGFLWRTSWLDRTPHVRWNAAHVRLIDPLSGHLLREHMRQQRGRHRIQGQDRPTRTPLSTEQRLRRAEISGPHIGAVCRAMYQNLGEEGCAAYLAR